MLIHRHIKPQSQQAAQIQKLIWYLLPLITAEARGCQKSICGLSWQWSYSGSTWVYIQIRYSPSLKTTPKKGAPKEPELCQLLPCLVCSASCKLNMGTANRVKERGCERTPPQWVLWEEMAYLSHSLISWTHVANIQQGMSLTECSICPPGGERNENGSIKPVLRRFALQYCSSQAFHCGVCKRFTNVTDKSSLINWMADSHINYCTAQNHKGRLS